MLGRWGGLFLAIFNLVAVIGAPSVDAREFTMDSGPLRVRNVSPVMQLYGIPRMLGAQILDDGLEVSLNFEAANNFQSENGGETFVFFDGESYISSLRLRKGFAERWEWGLEIPWVAHSPGSLDGVVDEFHELFGLPDGERSLASRYKLDYLVRSGSTVYADFEDSVHELGDVRGFLGYEVFDGTGGTLSLRSQIKLPTGSVERLSGSEGTDFATWAEYRYALPYHRRALRFSVGGGMAYLDKGKLIPDAQES